MIIYISVFFISIMIFVVLSSNMHSARIVSTSLSKYDKKHFGSYIKKIISNLSDGIPMKFSVKTDFSVRLSAVAMMLAAVPVMVISGIRYDVGTDYFATYQSGFYRILKHTSEDGFEVGYYILNVIIQLFTDNSNYLFIVTSVIFVGFVYAAIYKMSVNIPLSIILFFMTRYYFIGLNCVRQFIALSIFLYASQYITKKDFKKYCFFSILAISFHYTTTFFFPIYFLVNFKIDKKTFVKLAVLCFGVFTFLSTVVGILLRGTKYQRLLSKYDVCGVKFMIFTVVVNLVILFFFYIGYEKKIDDIEYRLYLNIQICATLISLVLRTIPLIERIYWIYSFPLIISVPYVFKTIKSKSTRILGYFFIFAALTFYMIYDIIIIGDHEVLPYQTIFTNGVG